MRLKDPVGKHIKLMGLERAPTPVTDPWLEIVGVSSNMRNHGIRDDIIPEAYLPYSFSSYGGYQLFVRTAGTPTHFARAVESEILAIDRKVVPQRTRTMSEEIDLFQFAKPRFGLILFAVFAAIGLVLVSLGVYSVISYTVSQQKHEIGIRMALGASTRNVRGLVLRSGLRSVLAGIGSGLVLSFAVTRVLSSESSRYPHTTR
jgi:ABC-type antimicrobial peptide transport system permease subunit